MSFVIIFHLPKMTITSLMLYLSSVCLSLVSFFLSPSGKKFRSKPQLSRYLGNTVDLGCFDFRTGKMMPGKLQKNKQRLRHDPLSLAKVAVMDRTLMGQGLRQNECYVFQIIGLAEFTVLDVHSSAGWNRIECLYCHYSSVQ